MGLALFSVVARKLQLLAAYCDFTSSHQVITVSILCVFLELIQIN